jgi:hypothetical protein
LLACLLVSRPRLADTALSLQPKRRRVFRHRMSTSSRVSKGWTSLAHARCTLCGLRLQCSSLYRAATSSLSGSRFSASFANLSRRPHALGPLPSPSRKPDAKD